MISLAQAERTAPALSVDARWSRCAGRTRGLVNEAIMRERGRGGSDASTRSTSRSAPACSSAAPPSEPEPEGARRCSSPPASRRSEGMTLMPVWTISYNAVEGIARAARELGVDAMMIGVSQRNAIYHLLRGHVINGLVRQLPPSCHLMLLQLARRARAGHASRSCASMRRCFAVALDRLLLTLSVEIAVIIGVSRLLGPLFRAVRRQPQVLGEVVAGILLGPSLLGWGGTGPVGGAFPAGGAAVPRSPERVRHRVLHVPHRPRARSGVAARSRPRRPAHLDGRHHRALRARRGGGPGAVRHPRRDRRRAGFAVFLGAAMAITAFPVLARILIEHDLLRTQLGALTLTCAAINDIAGGGCVRRRRAGRRRRQD